MCAWILYIYCYISLCMHASMRYAFLQCSGFLLQCSRIKSVLAFHFCVCRTRKKTMHRLDFLLTYRFLFLFRNLLQFYIEFSPFHLNLFNCSLFGRSSCSAFSFFSSSLTEWIAAVAAIQFLRECEFIFAVSSSLYGICRLWFCHCQKCAPISYHILILFCIR